MNENELRERRIRQLVGSVAGDGSNCGEATVAILALFREAQQESAGDEKCDSCGGASHDPAIRCLASRPSPSRPSVDAREVLEARRALRALFIEVPEAVARDITSRVEAAFAALQAQTKEGV